MGFLDDARKKLTHTVDKHGTAISGGIDKAAAAADKKTGGKHGDKIGKASLKAKEALVKLEGKDGRPGAGPAGPAGPTDRPGPTGPRP